MLVAGNTIKGEITIAKVPPAGKGRRKLRAVCAGGEVIVLTGLRRKAEVRSGRALHTHLRNLNFIF